MSISKEFEGIIAQMLKPLKGISLNIVIEGLSGNKIGYNASVPMTKKGKRKSTGYPDIEFIDEFQRTNYLECKTYNDETDPKKKSMRTFYLSPSEDFKITKDAHHFLMSYEIYKELLNGNNLFKCKSWKILSIENLEVDVKYEFN